MRFKRFWTIGVGIFTISILSDNATNKKMDQIPY
jgi:hypothetical protein